MSLQVKDGPLHHTRSSNADLIEERNVVSVDSELGQVLQTTQVVINMLDVTMPGTLTEERKKEVEYKLLLLSVFFRFGGLVSSSLFY